MSDTGGQLPAPAWVEERLAELRRRSRELLGRCVADASLSDAELNEAVHSAGKQVKRMRAYLRLLRPECDAEVYRRHNALLRDAGRCLAELRARSALGETLDLLLRREVLGPVEHEQLKRWLQTTRAAPPATRSACARAAQVLFAAEELPLGLRAGVPSVVQGFYAEHNAARDWYRSARKSPDDRTLHEWRKHVKYHLHQLQLFHRPQDTARIAELRVLAEDLGALHDLAEFLLWLEGQTLGSRERTGRAARRVKVELETSCLHAGRGLFPRARKKGRTGNPHERTDAGLQETSK